MKVEDLARVLHDRYAERVRIHGGTIAPFDGPDADPAYRSALIDDVTALLKVLREPSPDMAIIGGNRRHLGAGDMWRAMIDAILEDAPAHPHDAGGIE